MLATRDLGSPVAGSLPPSHNSAASQRQWSQIRNYLTRTIVKIFSEIHNVNMYFVGKIAMFNFLSLKIYNLSGWIYNVANLSQSALSIPNIDTPLRPGIA